MKVKSNHVLILLMGAILLSVLALIGVLVYQGSGGDAEPASSRSGSITGDPSRTAGNPKTSNPVADVDRIKLALKVGKSYDNVVQFDVEGTTTSEKWGTEVEAGFNYLAELHMIREILENDGRRIVERRRILSCKQVRLVSKVKEVSIRIGTPGMLVLGQLERFLPGTIQTVGEVKPYVEQIIEKKVQSDLNDENTTLQTKLDSLSGKIVRLTYVNGKGITDLVCESGDLDSDQDAYLRYSAILSDCYILPDLNLPLGSHWDVPANQFVGYFDPSLRVVPHGEITLIRGADTILDGKPMANLRLPRSTIEFDDSTTQRSSVGRFTGEGTVQFDLGDNYVREGHLEGTLERRSESKNHWIYQEAFRSSPSVKVQYSCTMK
ncbi:MAG TPA: hypothetical protein VGP76_00615 [Planctomycetaceae bacterium]|jgi:hypothetical protein|nr:hypothetical protein [Planctomycetaceae bacterium]